MRWEANSIRLRVVGTTSEAQVVSPTEGAFLISATFSPDGKYIAYGVALKDQPLRLILCQCWEETQKNSLKRAHDVSFSPDGQRLAYLYNNLPEGKTSLVIATSTEPASGRW